MSIHYKQLTKVFRPTQKRIKNGQSILASKDWISNSNWAMRRDVFDIDIKIDEKLPEDGGATELLDGLKNGLDKSDPATIQNRIKLLNTRPMIRLATEAYGVWYDLYYISLFGKIAGRQNKISEILINKSKSDMLIFKGPVDGKVVGCLMPITDGDDI